MRTLKKMYSRKVRNPFDGGLDTVIHVKCRYINMSPKRLGSCNKACRIIFIFHTELHRAYGVEYTLEHEQLHIAYPELDEFQIENVQAYLHNEPFVLLAD